MRATDEWMWRGEAKHTTDSLTEPVASLAYAAASFSILFIQLNEDSSEVKFSSFLRLKLIIRKPDCNSHNLRVDPTIQYA